MTTVPGSLVWELVKKNNYFLIKQFGKSNAKVQFSKGPNNVHFYKFSAWRTARPWRSSHQRERTRLLSCPRPRPRSGTPLPSSSTRLRKEFRKMAKSVKNQVLTPEFCT
ncbi:hypothetical protein VPH35_079253 [Triticum aestivum]